MLLNELPNPLGGKLILSQNEHVRFIDDASLIITPSSGRLGILLLTDDRLVFEFEGQVSARELTAVEGVTVEKNLLYNRRFSDALKITWGPTSKEVFVIHNTRSKYSTEAVASTTLELRRRMTVREQASHSTQIVMDFSWMRDYLSRGGLVITTVKCPQCGGNVDLPEIGKATKCKYCGSTLYAQDLFARLKELVSGSVTGQKFDKP